MRTEKTVLAYNEEPFPTILLILRPLAESYLPSRSIIGRTGEEKHLTVLRLRSLHYSALLPYSLYLILSALLLATPMSPRCLMMKRKLSTITPIFQTQEINTWHRISLGRALPLMMPILTGDTKGLNCCRL